MSTSPSSVSDATALARQLSNLLPAMRILLKPGGRRNGQEPPPPEIRSQFRMMKLLHLAGQYAAPVSMQDLAAAMHVSPPTVTGIVKRAVAQGIVARAPDPIDGRIVLVSLTEAGQAQMAAHSAAHVAMLERLLVELDAADQRAIGEALPALERLLAVAHAASKRESAPRDEERERAQG